jgi:hypothetical protein
MTAVGGLAYQHRFHQVRFIAHDTDGEGQGLFHHAGMLQASAAGMDNGVKIMLAHDGSRYRSGSILFPLRNNAMEK